MLLMAYRLGAMSELLPNTIDLGAPYGAFPSRGSACARGPSFVTCRTSRGETSRGETSRGRAASLGLRGPQIFLNPVLAIQSEAKASAIASGAELHQRDSGGT
jgi:hypothetical protein